MLDALVRLDEALVECLDTSVWALSGTALVDGLDRIMKIQSQLEALRLQFIHEVHAQGIAHSAGATSTHAWLCHRYRTMPDKRSVELAAWLHHEGAPTAAALACGDLNPAQARVIAKAVADLPAEHRAEGQQAMIRHAAQLDPDGLSKIGDRLFETLDPDAADDREAKRFERAQRHAEQDRAFTLTDNGDGRVRVTGWLTRDAAAIVNAALDPLSKPAGADLDPTTPTQRRADALVDICASALNTGALPDNGGDRPQVVVTLNYDALLRQLGTATLDDGTRLTATQARMAACDAAIVPAVLGGRGQVLDIGRERRTFPAALRRALVLRDGGCAFPACDRPARWTDAHHVQPWCNGGKTSLSNACLLCRRHHRLIHQGDWQVRINPTDHLPEFLPPSYVDNERKPIRNNYHRRS